LPDRDRREAYSHEICSAGFWPGHPRHPRSAFLSSAYPKPAGYGDARVAPLEARFDEALGELILDYDVARAAADPPVMLLQFLRST
jgi:hypothetical protein